MIEANRAVFEKWSQEHMPAASRDRENTEPHRYLNSFVEECWQSWQAAERHYRAATPAPKYPDIHTRGFRILEAISNVLSKLESQILRNPDLPEAYKTILRDGYEARSSVQWLLSNLCPRHQEVQSMSSGPCPMCQLAATKAETCPTDALEALEELADLMEEVRTGAYIPDTFTNQPAREVIAKYRGGHSPAPASQKEK